MAPLEPWEKVFVNEDFLTSTHGRQSCISCHGGVQSPEKDEAHANLIADPTANPEKQCGTCHQEVVTSANDNLHSNLQGYWTVLNARSEPASVPALEEMFGNHCSSCHTTCGDCHISQPGSVGGGLLDGHNFEKTPPMTRTCTACHGSRVGSEYLGKHEDIPGDVHFRNGRMSCVSCHVGMDLHATADEQMVNRYAGEEMPSCTSCHETVGASGDPIVQHTIHQDKLSCQVCHSVTYTNCDGCHVAVSETTGNPFFKTDATYMGFFIGLNPEITEERPYQYVVLRHAPIAEDSFSYYGENLLTNFDSVPTWKFATPHNIQRKTPQNESCQSCHNNPDLFLTADKVAPGELDANRPVIVNQLPQQIP